MADEIKVKTQGSHVWMALALMVATRLWLGSSTGAPRRRAISVTWDRPLIQAVADQIRAIALCRDLLLAVDGFKSYVTACQRAFRTQLPRYGRWGRPPLVAWPNVAIVQVVKHRSAAGLSIERRAVRGPSLGKLRPLSPARTWSAVCTICVIPPQRHHQSLRLRLWIDKHTYRWVQRTPAMAAGLTDHWWSMHELFAFKVLPPPWTAFERDPALD